MEPRNERPTGRPGDHPDIRRPAGVRRRWWVTAGLGAVVLSYALLPVVAQPDTFLLRLIPLYFLLVAWGLVCVPVNGLGLSALRRAAPCQVLVGLAVIGVGVWFAVEDAGEPVIFSLGLLVYPGVALIVNPAVVWVVRSVRERRRMARLGP